MKKGLHIIALTALACLTTGCWTKATNPKADPYEGFNRGVFNFNRGFDKVIARPIAKVYHYATPPFFQKGVRNAFNNLNELVSFPNDIFQGKINYSLIDLTRLLINTTIGIGGLFDPASHMGLPKHYNDYGLTFAYYSDKKTSPYLELPIIGPSTFRNAVALPLYVVSYPPTYFSTVAAWSVYAAKYTSIRADLLDTDKFVDEAFDPYIAVRNAYLQRRNALVARNDAQKDYDPNNPPDTNFSENVPTDDVQTDTPYTVEDLGKCAGPEANGTCVKEQKAKTPAAKPAEPKKKELKRVEHRFM